MSNTISPLIDKILIEGIIELKTGMHIGSSDDFASIGAVDSIVVRNPVSGLPIIPGSSLKGKLRSLLAKYRSCHNKQSNDNCNDYSEPNKDDNVIKRLFGATNPNIASRLQFFDLELSNPEKLEKIETGLRYTEIKFENRIDREAGSAKDPRQLERVPAGAEFKFYLVYNLENENEINEDFENISTALKLLQLDYIGGSGTRGYGRLNINNLSLEAKLTEDKYDDLQEEIEKANDRCPIKSTN